MHCRSGDQNASGVVIVDTYDPDVVTITALPTVPGVTFVDDGMGSITITARDTNFYEATVVAPPS